MRLGAQKANCIRFAGQIRCLLLLLVLQCPALSLGQQYEFQYEGRSYVDLATLGGTLGMKAYWLKDQKTFRLRGKWTNIDFKEGEWVLYLDRVPVYLGFPTVESDGRLYLAKADKQHVIQPILTPQIFHDKPEFRRIVIDAGHGGRDSGAMNDDYGLYEKTLALDVARRLKSILERAGFEVVMTRNSDVYIPLEQRPQIARQENGDLFVSIHFNAAKRTAAEGFETFILTPQHQASSNLSNPGRSDHLRYLGNAFDPWNALAGYHIQRALVKRAGGPDRGLKRARFLVLKHLNCPGVLVELGFISNPSTARKTRSAAFRQTLAQSLFDGIVTYGKRLQNIH